MACPTQRDDPISRIGHEIYVTQLRAKVETEENIGKLISIDIHTGDYEIEDKLITAIERLYARRPGAEIWSERIGYNAVFSSVRFASPSRAVILDRVARMQGGCRRSRMTGSVRRCQPTMPYRRGEVLIMTDNLATVRESEIDRVIGDWMDMVAIDTALRHTLGL